MDRINNVIGILIDQAGHRIFEDEDLPNGVVGTDLPDVWLNGVQESIIGVVEAAALVPTDADNTQLLQAIKLFIQTLAVTPLTAAIAAEASARATADLQAGFMSYAVTTAVPVPAWATKGYIKMWAGGAGGGGSEGASSIGAGAGAGEYFEGLITNCPSGGTIEYTHSTGGVGGVAGANGTDAGVATLAGYLTLHGGHAGYGGNGVIATVAGAGGTGGAIVANATGFFMDGGGGGTGYNAGAAWIGGDSGSAFAGGTARSTSNGTTPENGQSGRSYGDGGSGGVSGGNGGNGHDGFFAVLWLH